MSDGDALLRAILLNPADDTARLVYADWLQENGDEKRAEFIRDTRGNWFYVNHLWGELVASIPTASLAGYGREDETGLPRWTFNLPHLFGKAIYSRGFVSEIHLPLDAFMTHAKSLFRTHPIERVTLTDQAAYPRGRNYRVFWFHPSVPPGSQQRIQELPEELYDRLRLHENRPSDVFRVYENRAIADAALSAGCVAYGRSLAGLSQP